MDSNSNRSQDKQSSQQNNSQSQLALQPTGVTKIHLPQTKAPLVISELDLVQGPSDRNLTPVLVNNGLSRQNSQNQEVGTPQRDQLTQKTQSNRISAFFGNVLSVANKTQSVEAKRKLTQEDQLAEDFKIMDGNEPEKENQVTNRSNKEKEHKLNHQLTINGDQEVRTYKRLITKKDLEFEETYQQKQRKICLIYQDNLVKEYWDIFITALLLYSCMLIPYRIAFVREDTYEWQIALIVMDCFFGMDIILCFFSTFTDEDFNEIDNRKYIAKNYIQGWFTIDISAIFPFDHILQASASSQTSDVNGLVRFARFGRLYKLVKLTRLLRVVKVMAQKNKMLKVLTKIMNVPKGFDRLFFFFAMFLILSHTVSCLFVIIATVEDQNWMSDFLEIQNYNEFDFYTLSFYWTITTITTVGYGDISATSTAERWFCSLVMVIGVISFSFANGSLGLIITQMNHKQQILTEKIQILDKIKKNYNLSDELYLKCKRNLEYNQNNEFDEMNKFLDDLPLKLKVDISLFIYEERYKHIQFFNDKSSSFLQWVCSLLRQQLFQERANIYFEDEDITQIYFLLKGKCGFVLPQYQNIEYISIRIGDEFGIVDIIASSFRHEFDFDKWIQNKQKLQRQFAVMSFDYSTEVLSLSLKDLNSRALRLQCRAIKSCKKQIRRQIERVEEAFALRESMKDSQLSEKTKMQMQKRVKLVYDRVENLHEEVHYSSHFQSSSSSISDSDDEDEDDSKKLSSLEIEELSQEDTKGLSKIQTDANEAQVQEINNFDDKVQDSYQKSNPSAFKIDVSLSKSENIIMPVAPITGEQVPQQALAINITNLQNQKNVKSADIQSLHLNQIQDQISKKSADKMLASLNDIHQPDTINIKQEQIDQDLDIDKQNNIKQIQRSINQIQNNKDETILSDLVHNPSENKPSIQLQQYQSVRNHNNTPINQLSDKDDNKTNQNVLGTEISLGKQMYLPSIGNETVLSQTNKNSKQINQFQFINQEDNNQDQKMDQSALNQTNLNEDSFHKLFQKPQAQILQRGTSREQIPGNKIPKSPADGKNYGDIAMNQTMSRIVNIMRQKSLSKKLREQEQPHERTAQTILKTRNLPKKNVTKEAKNMLNSLSNSLRKNANSAMLIGSPANNMSPLKSNQPLSMFFGTPTQHTQQPLMPQPNQSNIIPQFQSDSDPQNNINKMLVDFLKKQINGDDIAQQEQQKSIKISEENQNTGLSNNFNDLTSMTESQKINMMLGLLIQIQKNQEQLKQEIKQIKDNQSIHAQAIQASSQNASHQQIIPPQQYQQIQNDKHLNKEIPSIKTENDGSKIIQNNEKLNDIKQPSSEQIRTEDSAVTQGINKPMASITEQLSSEMASSKDNQFSKGPHTALTNQISLIQKQDAGLIEQEQPIDSASTNKNITKSTKRKRNSAVIKDEKTNVLEKNIQKSKETTYSSIVIASSNSSKYQNKT